MNFWRIFGLVAVVACTSACGNDIGAPGISAEDLAPSVFVPHSVHDGADPSQFTGRDTTIPPPPPVPDTPVATYIIAVSATTQSAPANAWVDDPPEVEVRDAKGAPLAGQRVRFTLDSGGGLLAPWLITTDEHGRAKPDLWRLGNVAVTYHVAVTLEDHPDVAKLDFNATIATDFSIAINYLTAVSDTQHAAFEHAAARWAAVITNDLSDFTARRSELSTDCAGLADPTAIPVDDVLIFAEVKAIDGVGNTLAEGGPCWQRDTDDSTGIGIMTFDSADLAVLETKGVLEVAVLHEMGHVLGIGTFWKPDNLINTPSLPSSPGVNTTFVGPHAALAFTDLGGTGFPAAVPLDNSAIVGSADAHWRESVLANELMTSTITGKEAAVPLSILTIASLQDLGPYTVNMGAADSFSLMPALRAAEAPAEPLGTCGAVPVTQSIPLGQGFRQVR